MAVVVNKPRDLTREQLKETRLLLDTAGYSEAKLQTAVRSQTNLDIAASIIDQIRRAALGEPLVPSNSELAKPCSASTKTSAGHPPNAAGWTPGQTTGA